jgi:Arc/MetJ-type ribon-helix-helix transcriptional regulator
MPRPELYPVKKMVGFDQVMIDDVEKWRAKQRPIPNVSEAIRQLVGQALSSTKTGGRRSAAATHDASLMAGRAIDRLADTSAPDDEQASRKKRLLQGPKEFREMRAKSRKPKAP